MLHIYYGMGKGKTSTLNGSAIRAKGSGMNVLILRFLKGRRTSEDKMLKNIGISIHKVQSNEKFVIQMSKKEKQKTTNELHNAITYLKEVFNKFDLIILDEFLDLLANNVNLMSKKEVIDIIDLLKEKEVMISGHNKYEEIFEKADLITFFNSEKHYYDNGIKARKGVEY